jgi:anti-repressor protein
LNEQDGEPWFVAKEVADILGYANPSRSVNDHCKSVKTCPTEMVGQVRHMQIIPERDVYRLVMRSNLPEAEKFEDWVVSEVLPSIRKTGGYIPTQEDDPPEVYIAKALQIANATLERHRKKTQAIQETVDQEKPKD